MLYRVTSYTYINGSTTAFNMATIYDINYTVKLKKERKQNKGYYN